MKLLLTASSPFAHESGAGEAEGRRMTLSAFLPLSPDWGFARKNKAPQTVPYSFTLSAMFHKGGFRHVGSQMLGVDFLQSLLSKCSEPRLRLGENKAPASALTCLAGLSSLNLVSYFHTHGAHQSAGASSVP